MVLSTLAKYNVTATFFINGNSLGKGRIDDPTTPWPQILRNMYAAGHQLASHTWTHQDLTSLPQNLMANQVIYNEMAFRNIFGFFPTYLRPPYGYCAGASNCSTYLNSMGYHIIIWDVDTKDYLNDDTTLILNSENYFAGNTSNPANGHSYIPLAHDIHLNTALTLVTYMLETLLARGYKVVTLGECLGDPRSNWYRDGVTGGVVTSSSTTLSVTKATSTGTVISKGTNTGATTIQALSAVAESPTTSHAGISSATSTLTPNVASKSGASRLFASSWLCCVLVIWSWIVSLNNLH
jgi:peptidoglycan/xylan/chitin deacetylase (PgdA/CDA1 family)